MKSTMGAPLSDAEEARITLSWGLLCAHTPRLLAVADPIEMLEIAAELIGRAHALQRAIHECWSSANRRAFPGTQPSARKVMSDLESLGLSADDVLAAINIIRTQESPE